MPTTEHTINDALAAILRDTRHAWRRNGVVKSENTGTLKRSGKKPDILVAESNVSPVVIETEVMPARTVESDARARVGEQMSRGGRAILSVIAVRLPERLRRKQSSALHEELLEADDLDMAMFTGESPEDAFRWPSLGWIRGSVADLSILTQSASVPPAVIEQAANVLVDGVSNAADLMAEMAANHPAAVHKISEELRQEDGEQTRRMAATILANAFVFQETLAGGPGGLSTVESLDQLRSRRGGLSKAAVLAEWRKILLVNYWPIFDIARRVLEPIPGDNSKALIERMAETAERLLADRVMRSHDLTGAVFQKLIADRKFLAAYYTTPASAALLVGLAVEPSKTPAGGAWSSASDVRALRIADLACGTGTLLSTAYQRVGQLHELAGGDAEAVHGEMMAQSLTGCDVLPAAAHLTASMLAGAHPTVNYAQSSILTLAYGRQPDGSVALGSLNLLDPQRPLDIVEITAKAIGGLGESETRTWLSLPHAAFDLVIMNPPFTRPTVHEAERLNVPNPMFAAFASSAEEQRLMSAAARRLTRGTSAHGNAGEASIFLVLADRKLRPGGTLALVMPLSLTAGDSWEASRIHLAKHYGDLVFVSIAGRGSDEMAFSADTGMAECLIVGRRVQGGTKRATFVVLGGRPEYALKAATAATQIRRLIAAGKLHRLEDGPVGGTLLYFGNDVIGQVMEAPLPASGGWNLTRIADLSLAQSAYQLVNEARAWLPTMEMSDAVSLPITTVEKIGELGPIHRDINGRTPQGGIRGPFDTVPIRSGSVPTYPVLWAHDADRERTMSFEADFEGISRHGATSAEREILAAKIAAVWHTASHCHFNCDFQFNSQSTAMQFTSRETIGGRAWLAIKLASVEQEKALVLWANTTLGLLLRWWHSNKQQSGRGNIGKTMLQTLPVLDVTALGRGQLAKAVALFDAMSGARLLPVNEIDNDPVRKELDEAFAHKILGAKALVGPLELLRMKLAQEPSIRGSKSLEDPHGHEDERDDGDDE